VKMSSKNISWG